MSKKLILLLLVLLLPVIFIKDILVGYASFFVVDNATKGADAIILLAGNSGTRAPHAAKIYKEGYAPIVLVTDPKSGALKKYPFQIDDNKYSEMILDYEGVQNVAKIPSQKDGATSTIDEALDFGSYAKDKGFKRVILVTDEFHTKRSLYAFNKILKERLPGVIIEASAARNVLYNENDWYLKEMGISNFLLEGVKFLLYIFISENVKGVEEH